MFEMAFAMTSYVCTGLDVLMTNIISIIKKCIDIWVITIWFGLGLCHSALEISQWTDTVLAQAPLMNMRQYGWDYFIIWICLVHVSTSTVCLN